MNFKKVSSKSYYADMKDFLEKTPCCKWDGVSKEYWPALENGARGANGVVRDLQAKTEYIETGGSERFIQKLLSLDGVVIKDERGHYYYVELNDDDDTIVDARYIPTTVSSMLHSSDQRHVAEDLIGKSFKDIIAQVAG